MLPHQKVRVIGSGFVSDHLSYEKIPQRLESLEQIRLILSSYPCDVLINCIGKTGRPNIDWCENNKLETAWANVAIPIALAEECAKRKIKLIQIGSGCIYFGESPHTLSDKINDGAHAWHKSDSKMPVYQFLNMSQEEYGHWVEKPQDFSQDTGWQENDSANPKSFYSKSKYSCDFNIGSLPNVATLRIRMPVSTLDTPRNLINKLRGYKQIIDIPNSMTFMDDLVRCIDWVIDQDISGIWHVTNPEPLTAAQIMKEYQKYVPEHQFEIITKERLDALTKAERSNCILDTSKLKNAGFQMTPSQEALEKCMKQYIGKCGLK